MGSPSAATTRMSAASLSHGCMRAGAARRSTESATVNARRPVLPDGTHSHQRCRIRARAVDNDDTDAGATGSPPPPAGEGQGGGTQEDWCRLTPSPTLPRKRGRERTESLDRKRAEFAARSVNYREIVATVIIRF